ncbi:hypothetical protein B296_00054918, partial [Ensete ventricosum]
VVAPAGRGRRAAAPTGWPWPQQTAPLQGALVAGTCNQHYFHDFSKERTMMLKVFSDNDLWSTAHDHKKIESLQRQYQHGIRDAKPF